jgi:hypothetical protein
MCMGRHREKECFDEIQGSKKLIEVQEIRAEFCGEEEHGLTQLS